MGIGAEDYEGARRTAARAREVSDDDRTRKNQQKAEVALKQSKEVNHYKVLGVPRDARTRDIKKAYRDAALKYHPDKIAPDVSDRSASDSRPSSRRSPPRTKYCPTKKRAQSTTPARTSRAAANNHKVSPEASRASPVASPAAASSRAASGSRLRFDKFLFMA